MLVTDRCGRRSIMCYRSVEGVRFGNDDKSTVLRGEPSCLRVTTIRWHHVIGSPYGIHMVFEDPHDLGHVSGVVWMWECTLALGIAFGFKWIWTDGPSIYGRRWCGHKSGRCKVIEQPLFHFGIVFGYTFERQHFRHFWNWRTGGKGTTFTWPIICNYSIGG